MTRAIRTPEIDRAAAAVARLPKVRAVLVARQRQVGADGGIVMEGRDIGTVVFPHADVKMYLDATPEERARRRAADPSHSGVPAAVSDVATLLTERDRLDRTRAASPLYAADDAVVIDTTGKSVDEVVREVLVVIRAKDWARAARAQPLAPSPEPAQPLLLAISVILRRSRIELPPVLVALDDFVAGLQLLVVAVFHAERPADVVDDVLSGVGLSPPGASSPVKYASSRSTSTSPPVISGDMPRVLDAPLFDLRRGPMRAAVPRRFMSSDDGGVGIVSLRASGARDRGAALLAIDGARARLFPARRRFLLRATAFRARLSARAGLLAGAFTRTTRCRSVCGLIWSVLARRGGPSLGHKAVLSEP